MTKGGRPEGQTLQRQCLEIEKLSREIEAHLLNEAASKGSYGVDAYLGLFTLPGPSASALVVLRHNLNRIARMVVYAAQGRLIEGPKQDEMARQMLDALDLAEDLSRRLDSMNVSQDHCLILTLPTKTGEPISGWQNAASILEGQITEFRANARKLARQAEVIKGTTRPPSKKRWSGHRLAEYFVFGVQEFWFAGTGKDLPKSDTGTHVDFAIALWQDLRFPPVSAEGLASRIKSRRLSWGGIL